MQVTPLKVSFKIILFCIYDLKHALLLVEGFTALLLQLKRPLNGRISWHLGITRISNSAIKGTFLSLPTTNTWGVFNSFKAVALTWHYPVQLEGQFSASKSLF